MRESRNVGFGRVRDRITKIIPGNRKPMYQGGSIELIKIKAVFHFWTHFRKNLEVGNPCGEVRVLEKPVFFGGRDSDYGNSILNNFLPENTHTGSIKYS